MPRSFNPNLVKKHRTYRVDEVAVLFGCSKGTVRRWLKKDGLEAIDNSRPLLIHGGVLKAFLNQRRLARKRSCKPNEMYCMRCKAPQKPLDLEVWWEPQTRGKGRLIGCCESCGATLNRFANRDSLEQIADHWSIRLEAETERLTDSDKPALNEHFDGAA